MRGFAVSLFLIGLFLIGLFLGSFTTLFLTANALSNSRYWNSQAIEQCEAELPRNHECELIAVPASPDKED